MDDVIHVKFLILWLMQSAWLYTRTLIIFYIIGTCGTFQNTLSLYTSRRVISKEETQEWDKQSLPLGTVSYFLCATLGYVLTREETTRFLTEL